MTPPPADAPKKRWWRSRWLWAAAACLILLTAASPYSIPLYEDWQLNRDLAAAIAETDRLDPGWRREDLAGKRETIADEENAALVLRKIAKLLGDKPYSPQFKDVPLPVWIVATVPISREHYVWISRIDESLDNPPEANRLNDLQMLALASEKKQYPEAFVEARKLGSYRKCQFPPASYSESLRNSFAGVSAIRLLRLDLFQLCEAGDLNQALDNVDALLALVLFETDSPHEPEFRYRDYAVLTACGCSLRILAHGVPDAARLVEIQGKLLKEEDVNSLLLRARANRMRQAEVFWVANNKSTNDSDRKLIVETWARMRKKEREPKERPWFLSWLPQERPTDPRLLQTWEMHHFNRLVEFARKPIDEQFDSLETFLKQEEVLFGAGSCPTHRETGHNVFRTHMTISTTRTAIALERYRQATGDWPRSLDQLVPEYLAEVPTDHFARKPLQFRRVEKGCIVYSVGQDRTDNAGKLRREPGDQTYGFDGLDIGVRLWDPAHRRQPPVLPRERQKD